MRNQSLAGTGVIAPVQLISVTALLAVAGAVLAAALILQAPTPSRLPPSSPSGETTAIGEPVATSFGVVVVQHVEKTNGLTARNLAGMTHGIGALVPPNKAQIEASVTLSNTTDHTVAYSPKQFRLIAGSKVIQPNRANIRPGILQPDAAIDALLQFVIPRDGASLKLSFADRAVKRSIVVDLGRVNLAPPNAIGGFHNHH